MEARHGVNGSAVKTELACCPERRADCPGQTLVVNASNHQRVRPLARNRETFRAVERNRGGTAEQPFVPEWRREFYFQTVIVMHYLLTNLKEVEMLTIKSDTQSVHFICCLLAHLLALVLDRGEF